MEKKIRVLAIDPGSTSTKIALFDDYQELFRIEIKHSLVDLEVFDEIQDQLGFRTQTVSKVMEEKGCELGDVDVFCGRGGGLFPISAGVFNVSDLLASHASQGMSGQHPAQLGSQIAKHFADRYGKRAFVVNTPDVDEFCDVARVTGVRGIYRQSHVHTLNQKEVALRYCASRGLKYEQVNLIICHLGGGISITAHEHGRMIDSNDIINGSGPMTPTRAGDMPYARIIDMAYSGEYTKKGLIDRLNRGGGLTSHFGTSDFREVLKIMETGDKHARVIIDSLVYQCAKYIGAMAVSLKGKAKAIILTGGISHSAYFIDEINKYVGWIAETAVIPGEFELEALAAGAVRVMRGEEELKEYSGAPIWNGFSEE